LFSNRVFFKLNLSAFLPSDNLFALDKPVQFSTTCSIFFVLFWVLNFLGFILFFSFYFFWFGLFFFNLVFFTSNLCTTNVVLVLIFYVVHIIFMKEFYFLAALPPR